MATQLLNHGGHMPTLQLVLRYFVYILLAIFLTACSSSKSSKHVPAKLVEFKSTMSIKTAWSFDVGSSSDYVFVPAFARDSIFGASANGNLARIDNASGREIWRVEVGSKLTAGVGADDSTLAVVGIKGTLFAYDLDGKLRWKTQLASEVLAAPAVGEGTVVVRGVNNHIEAYDSLTGKRRWSVERTLPPLILRSITGMTIAANTVFVGLPGGKLIAIALPNGAIRWETTVGEPRGTTELERVADVSGKPIIVGTDVCAAAYQSKVSCFDIRNGVMRWGKKLSTSKRISADERFVFAVDDKDTVYAFTRSGGWEEWKNDQLAYRQLSSPISYGQAVAVADSEGHVHFLSREKGTFLTRINIGGAVTAPPMTAEKNIIFQTKAGKIIALAID